MWLSDEACDEHVGLLGFNPHPHKYKLNNIHIDLIQKKLPHVAVILTLFVSSLWEEGHLDSSAMLAPWCGFQDKGERCGDDGC